MGWKEFLMPDWRKIVVFVIVFVLMPIPVFNDNGYEHFWTFAPFGIVLLSLLVSLFLTSYPNISYEGILIILIVLFISYLLSCLIVWAYDKLKKKPEKKKRR